MPPGELDQSLNRQRLGQAGAPGAAPGGAAPGGESSDGGDDDVIDAEFEEKKS